MELMLYLVLVFGLLVNGVYSIDNVTDADFITQMRQAPNKLAQYKLITGTDGWVYNFSTNAQYSLSPGSVCNANTATYPSMTGLDMTVAQINLGPCSQLPPHLHRSTNMVVAVTGTTHTYMIQENGADVVETELSNGLMTIFPQASVHWMVNEGCETNLLYSFLNGEDPSTITLANAMWRLGADIVDHVLALNVSDDDWTAMGKKMPGFGTGAITGYDRCMQQCGLQKSPGAITSGYVKPA